MKYTFCILLVCLVAVSAAVAELPQSSTTKIVLLGTGTPNPEPDRSGPAVAIIVNDTPYLVDFGPGVVRRAAAMSPTYGGNIAALEVERLKVAFLTHLHSDHSAGLPDLLPRWNDSHRKRSVMRPLVGVWGLLRCNLPQ